MVVYPAPHKRGRHEVVGQFDCGRLPGWKTDGPGRILGDGKNYRPNVRRGDYRLFRGLRDMGLEEPRPGSPIQNALV
jgi:hypothetical protein